MNFTQTSRVIPAGACDCHAHIYGPFDQFPLGRSAPFQPPLAPAKALEGLWEAFGVERAVLIQGSAYRQDHRALLAGIARDRNNRRGVALVEPTTPDATLKHLHENGVCGARVNYVRHLNSKGFDEASCWQVVRRIEPLGWHLELHVDAADLGRIREFVRESPVDAVIDHMGRVDAELGPLQAPFRTLLELASSRMGNDNYHSFSGDSYFSRLFWVLSARFFGVFLGWFSAFAGAGFRPPGGEATEGRRQRRVGGILRA